MLTLAHPAPPDWVASPGDVPLAGEEPCPVKTTLLVMPANLMPQWQEEIGKHVAPGGWLVVCVCFKCRGWRGGAGAG